MATSIFLAKLIGPVCSASSAWRCSINGAAFRTLAPANSSASPALMFLSGVITLPAGLAIVLTHNVWTADWRVLITILGWLAVIGGAIRISVPQQRRRRRPQPDRQPAPPCKSAPRSSS